MYAPNENNKVLQSTVVTHSPISVCNIWIKRTIHYLHFVDLEETFTHNYVVEMQHNKIIFIKTRLSWLQIFHIYIIFFVELLIFGLETEQKELLLNQFFYILKTTFTVCTATIIY